MAGTVLNFNVGVLGHVDSGKTSLSKALSTVASTASFDKNPQSKERGITLDLGFSSFNVDVNDDKKEELKGYSQIQFTLVDCPGHASLIRTIIGGAQIIDLMLLVIDVTKGMQTQTAECLIIGEITCHKMIVVLNKLDMVAPEKQTATVEKMKKRMWKTLESTKFSGCPIIAVAAKPGGPEAPETEATGVQELISTLQQSTYLPARSEDGDFIFSADHCFSIRGQGTVMTGTVLSGKVSTNDTVEIPSLGTSKKVKSMQMFRKPVEKIKQGDRAGICVTQFDPSQLERGLVCSAGALVTVEAAIVSMHKIAYYKSSVSNKAKFHITIGHETVMGKISLFCAPAESKEGQTETPEKKDSQSGATSAPVFDFSKEYDYLEELLLPGKQGTADLNQGTAKTVGEQFALIELERPVTCSPRSLVIGSRLDADIHTSACRIAFHGQILVALTDNKYKETILPNVKVFKIKTREGQVERATDKYSVIGKNLFKKETNLAAFANLKISLSSGERGTIEGGFGQSGKVKIRIPEGLSEETYQRYSGTSKKKGKGKEEPEGTAEGAGNPTVQSEPVKIFLNFKRFLYDPQKAMVQT
ncbi:selenocysteine-specific elongation factor [Aplysia californica]|uniref:Selenocysteine-specific elongation factor n=1 Tax=Aplysia californica TaxID=6500 RepID=A0ABM1A0B9_APLCA|nr:selenocysteine-specific elongation factor [Aplysia californica]